MAVCQLEVPASFSDLARASGPVAARAGADSDAAALKLKFKLRNPKLAPGPGWTRRQPLPVEPGSPLAPQAAASGPFQRSAISSDLFVKHSVVSVPVAHHHWHLSE
jgi:hypothetical protein